MTKEECLKALDMLHDGKGHESFYGGYLSAYGVISCLINEHFELKEIIKKHGLENLTFEELDYAFKKMLGYVKENNRLMNQLVEVQSVLEQKQEQIRRYEIAINNLNNEIVKLATSQTSNPPLKFEELHKGMWVWDNLNENYIFVCHIDKEKRCIYEDYHHGGDGYWTYKFEENRFFLHEVKEVK